MQYIKYIIILLVCVSCKKIKNNYTTFTIKENKHRSTTSYVTSKDTVFNWKIIFDSSAIYNSIDSINQYDVNKLIGWSDCSSRHTENSIRFGWRWLNDNLEILWFKHENGEFSFDIINTINLCHDHTYNLIIYSWQYKLCVDNNCVFVPRNCPNHYRRYMLYPYFGGDETDPHDIKIRIKSLDL